MTAKLVCFTRNSLLICIADVGFCFTALYYGYTNHNICVATDYSFVLPGIP